MTGRRIGIQQKILGLVISVAVLPILMILLVGNNQKRQATDRIQTAIDTMIVEDLRHITHGFYDLCKTANDFTQLSVDHALNVAYEEVVRHGGLSLGSQRVTWRLENQFNGERDRITLPAMMVGDTWLGQERSPSQPVAVVDEMERLMGATCTIFQRMNPDGDMLRVATNVPRADQSRAIGTYIPRTNPDGTPNDVVETILAGHVYRGRAFVVNDWYLTAYQPLWNGRDEIIGMLYVGVRQESAESFRTSILSTTVGQTGFLFALGGEEPQQGQWIISRRGCCDGDSGWDQKDADGQSYVRTLVQKALVATPGEVQPLQFTLDEGGKRREVLAMVTYFEPWDWVIGTLAYIDEYQEARDQVDTIMSRFMHRTAVWGIVFLVVAAFIAFILARRMVLPIVDMSHAAHALMRDRPLPGIDYHGVDEVSTLAETFNTMATKIRRQRDDLESTNAELSQANATKDRFFSIIAHDLKNPFNTLLTYSETLLENYDNLDEEKRRRGIATLKANSERGYNLLLDLLNWARSQSGSMEINLGPVHVSALARENIEILAERAEQKGISLEMNVPEACHVYGDHNMVNTVIRNLMTNAVKFTAEGGLVTLESNERDGQVEIAVVDTGIGISPENQAKLFRLDTFYRTTGTDRERGTGLGLILCKEFVEKLGGRIWVESEEGKGSRFAFTLPVLDVPAEA